MSGVFISARYDVTTRTVDYASADGRHLLRTGGAIAWRFNNPGNIRPASEGQLIMGAIGIGKTKGNGSFLIFPSYEAGRAQKRSLLRRKYNDRTIYTMLAGVPDRNGNLVRGYAPASDGNKPVEYAQQLSRQTGLPVDTVLSTMSDAQFERLLDAMELVEGFHGQKNSRSEKWIDTTSIVVSDGAQPKPHLPVLVKVGETVLDRKTNARGELPKIAHTQRGQKVEIHLPGIGGEFRKQFEFVMGEVSNAFVLFHSLLQFQARTAPKRGTAGPPSRRQPIRYVVQPGDTVSKIAQRYRCTISSIKQHNPHIKDVSKIYVGQTLSLYGPTSAPASRQPRPVARPAATTPGRSAKGAPLAIVQLDQRQAPWMTVAIDEAKRWAGNHESIITRSRNYHRELDTVGNLGNVPWCASLVNFCLKESGTPYERSQSSQFPVTSRKFVKIDKPVYGALMVLRNYDKETGKFAGSGHITFVYGRTGSDAIAGLGGNQGNTLKLSRYRSSGTSSTFRLNGRTLEQRFHAFYIPATYAEYAQHCPDIATVSIEDVNKNLLGINQTPTSRNEGTR